LYGYLSSLQQIISRIQKLLTNQEFKSADFAVEQMIWLLPKLLERQSLIIDRIKEIESANKIKELAVRSKEDSNVNLSQELEKLQAMSEKWLELSTENEQARKEAQKAADEVAQRIALRQEERAALKEKWALWQSLLHKESVSTIVGAFLLVIIVIAEIIASFTHTATTQILDNGFLVLLGYFFGQTVARASRKQDE
jgi:hypothetical protein